MDYKTQMRQLIDIVKQNSFEGNLEDTMDDLITLTGATKDLTDRINTRIQKSLNVDSKSLKKPIKGKALKAFPSVAPSQKSTPLPTQNSVSATATSAKDIDDMRRDFVTKQKAAQAITPQPPISTF